LKAPRVGQLKAMEFIDRAIQFNYEHVVIEAPTGTGKTLLGAAACLRHGQGYYLVTQKLLQDQLETELEPDPSLECHLLKSSTEYACPAHKSCAMGSLRRCQMIKSGNCEYQKAKALFLTSKIGVTNYPFFMTERLQAQKLGFRPAMVLDECHTLERQIIRLVDFTINSKQLEKWNLDEEIPKTEDLDEFLKWVNDRLMPMLTEKANNLIVMSEGGADEKLMREAVEVNQNVNKLKQAIKMHKEDPEGWVYWQQEQEDGSFEAVLRPLDAAPFAPILFEMGGLKVHMSAYPGSKLIYCRSLGLDPSKVGWCRIDSSFKKENRPVLMTFVGHMRKAEIEKTLPKAIKFVEMILSNHEKEKGLIHANSYKIAKAVVDALRKTRHGSRLIYPENSDQREEAFNRHRMAKGPTVIISPSMTEGFDFAHDLARWQVIMKVPYPNLGDKQINAKRLADAEWYQLETVKTIIQASGRICRAEDDFGRTYFLDADFMMLWDRYRSFFPTWWAESVHFVKGG